MYKGVFTPMVTIFDSEGGLDYDGNRRVIEHLIAGGVNGILFLGSIGEFFNLTMEEKKKFINFAVKTVDKRVAVFIGTGGTVVEEVKELTGFSEKEGADAAVAISPYYFNLDEGSLYRYYGEVAGCVKMPVFLYNFPDRTSVNMSPGLIAKLAKDFRNIIGIKDTVDNISHTRKIINRVKPEDKDFIIFSGFDEYLVPNLMAGGDGLIGGLSNIVPAWFAKLYNAYVNKDMIVVNEMQLKINLLMELYDVSQPFVTAIKAAVSLAVKGVNPMVRKPAGALDGRQFQKVKDILMNAGLI